MFISGCNFYNTDIDGKLIFGGNPLKLFSCKFFDNSQVMIDGAGYQISNSHFTNSGSAIVASDIYMPSFYRNGTMTNCMEAVTNLTSNTTVSINKVIINSQGGGFSGIYQSQGLLNLKCSKVSGDDYGIYLYESGLNSSMVGNTGGYSIISGSLSNVYLDNATFLNLDNGYNNLLPSVSGKIISGNLNTACGGDPWNIPANNNKWLNNAAIDPNTTGASQPNNTYPNAYNNPTANGQCDVRFIDNNRGNTALCAQFDPNPIGGISQTSVFKSCTSCPMVNGTFFNNIRMDEAILMAMEKMELIDSTLSDPNRNDFTAIRMFNEIIAHTPLDLSDPDVAFLARFSYEMTKTSVQNCINTGRLTKANNNPNLHPCSNHYLEVLNALRQPSNSENYKEQFLLELDNALVYYWMGRYSDAVNYLKQIDICYLTDEEYRLINYWIATIELKAQFVSGDIHLDEYDLLNKKLIRIERPTPITIDPTSNINSTSSIGNGTTIGSGSSIGQNVIIGENCKIGNNVTLGKDVIIGKDVILSDNTIINKESIISNGTVIGFNASIGNNVEIGKNVVLSDNITIGQFVKIGDWAQIDQDASLAKETDIADGTYIGANTIIDQQNKIGSHVIIRRNSVIEMECKIADNVVIDNNAQIKKQTLIGKGAVIGESLTIGQNSKICDATFVNNNVPNNGIIGVCSIPTIPSLPFNVIHNEIFAVSHAHIYGKMEDGFSVQPLGDHYFVGQTLTFNAKEYGYEILWDFGNCTQSSSPSTSYSFTNPGVYVITLKVNPPQGCGGVPKVYIGSVSIHPKPTISVTPEIPNCPATEPIVFNIDFNAGNTSAPGCMSKYGLYCTYAQLKTELCRLNINSDYGDGNSETNQFLFSQLFSGINQEKIYDAAVAYNYNFTGSYEAMQLTTENWIPIDYETNDKGTISLTNTLNAQFELEEFVCASPTYTILNTSNFFSELNYDWNLSDGQSSSDEYPTFDFSITGQFTLTLEVSNPENTCSDSKTVSFEVGSCMLQSMMEDDNEPLISDNSLKVNLYPNPNDGEFSLVLEGVKNEMELIIYDSQGKIVFCQQKINNGITKINVRTLFAGIYHWKLFNVEVNYSNDGNFVIIR